MPILKPSSCVGCPFYDKSDYFTPDLIIPSSKVVILAQNPGKNEEEGAKLIRYSWYNRQKVEDTESVTPQPLIGATGEWLQREFWPLTKIKYEEVSKCNVIKCRPGKSNDLPNIGNNKPVNGLSIKMLKDAIKHCTNNHLKLPSSTKYIMAMGEISLYALTGEELLNYKKSKDEEGEKKSTVSEWRGWTLGLDTNHKLLGLNEYYNCKDGIINIFPIVHVASLFKSPKYYHATLLDFIRFGKLVRNEWPSNLPDIKINTIPSRVPSIIGFDTEYTKENILTMYSIADVERNIYVIDSKYSQKLRNLPKHLTLITQNGLVDLPHLLPMLPDNFNTQITMQDCMLAHAVLWPGEWNGLDYMLSKYGEYNRHKHLRLTEDINTEYMYSGLDADSTLNIVWKNIVREFEKDTLSWNEYKLRRQPLLPIINKFQERGIQVWESRVNEITNILDSRLELLINEAKQLTGDDDFNLKSNKQVAAILYNLTIEKREKSQSQKVKDILANLKLKFGS